MLAFYYRLIFFIILSLIGCTSVMAATAIAPAGQVIVVAGRLQANQPNQPARLLNRGSAFYEADTLTTADSTEAQLRFTDGTLVALRPNTTLKIDRYRYAIDRSAKDSNDNGTVAYTVSLIKGGFRSLSGAIAKQDPNEYKINTNVATIGLRGTEFSLILDASGGLSAATYKGRIFLKNQAGYIEIGDGQDYQYAYVASAYTKPKGEPIRPVILLNDPRFVLIGPAGTGGSGNGGSGGGNFTNNSGATNKSININDESRIEKNTTTDSDDFCLN